MFAARSQFDAFTQAATLSAVEVEAQARRLRAEAVAKFAKSVFARLKAWRDHQRAVAELRGLDDAMLRDIGLNRAEIDAAVAGKVYRPRAAKVVQADASNENATVKSAEVVRLVPRQAA
ncbi:RSP_7527 family protein [Ferrovibrio sp.]|uniref:RSP_7527 family protein n=1 Tax=Ferrovibrio sp. TaxID=1917215 RepID=UPI0025B983D2|nr:DUF1127 domain-containing protein [Ferrovibrio sp.]MBX3455770.1 DUF1127 domain-containing protein [Ferrovibrio sp.]